MPKMITLARREIAELMQLNFKHLWQRHNILKMNFLIATVLILAEKNGGSQKNMT